MLGGFDKVVWFYEPQTPHVRRWRQVFNEGGERVRFPSTGYGYLSPYKVSFNSGVTDTEIDNSFQYTSASQIIRNTPTHRGTPGGSNYLVAYSTDGTQTTTRYTSDPADATTWFPMRLLAPVKSAARSILINARMRISQPKRSDRYGFLIYKNDTYQGFATGTGVGTLSGASVLFSHEDVHLSKNMDILLYPGDTISVVPVTLIVGSNPSVDAQIMEIDWELAMR